MRKIFKPAWCLLIIMFLLLSVVYLLSAKSVRLEKANNVLGEQVQEMSKTLTEQNKALEANRELITIFQSDQTTFKTRLQEFANTYTQITGSYVRKPSRGTVMKSANNTIEDIIKLNNLVKNLNTAFSSNNKLSQELEKTNTELEEFVAALPTFIPATGKITSPFGMRNHPITHIRTSHKGVDIDADIGDPIMASGSGKVIYAGYSSGYGRHIIIDHDNGFKTIYGHSSKLLVNKGKTVKKGQKIALVGSTGRSTGPHLHFEIRISDIAVDPIKYIEFKPSIR
ncbi:M23 family metallopeptidase [Ruminiclostridium cellulolyticum]|uniref:Peptidase M23 n=1 Tax=Ruminiclostridium cellulolyticum (strain ATCC 35319 / DSM 5812 / JCM 6584 / H10) TaxID=394503 RepID=B8I869_RUMCH|nr:M23 family metallopeptidase [Ruminiclostridium cellulolyticum]ACL77169.1 Peptidase M23 [Ruminiclostridium cellulolyticum H10]